MLVLDIFIKTIKELLRSRNNLLMIILTPIIFFSFFGFIYGSVGGGNQVQLIGIINNDIGNGENLTEIIPNNLISSTSDDRTFGGLYLDLLQNNTQKLVDSQLTLDLKFYRTEDEMRKDIEIQVISLGLIIPSNFTAALYYGYMELLNETTALPVSTSLLLLGDPSQQAYLSTLAVITESLTTFEDQIYGANRLYSQAPDGGYLTISTKYIAQGSISAFQFAVAGFLVFNALLQMISTTTFMAKEKEMKTINRLNLSDMKTWELFSGFTVAQLSIFSGQFVISIVVLSFWSIILTVVQWLRIYLLLLITTLALTGLSLIVAALVKTADDASTITGIASAPLGFLSGSFLPVPTVYIIKSLNFQFWDLIPTYHANQAIFEIIVNNQTLMDVMRNVLFLIFYTILIYILGIFTYNRKVIKGNLQ